MMRNTSPWIVRLCLVSFKPESVWTCMMMFEGREGDVSDSPGTRTLLRPAAPPGGYEAERQTPVSLSPSTWCPSWADWGPLREPRQRSAVNMKDDTSAAGQLWWYHNIFTSYPFLQTICCPGAVSILQLTKKIFEDPRSGRGYYSNSIWLQMASNKTVFAFLRNIRECREDSLMNSQKHIRIKRRISET